MAKDTHDSSQMVLTKTSLTAGIWKGELRGAGNEEPALVASHLGEQVAGLELEQGGDAWHVRFALPADRIADGVQTFVIAEAETGRVLNSFAVMVGEALGDNILAEMDLLRAELDMLKKAFRRHCVETM